MTLPTVPGILVAVRSYRAASEIRDANGRVPLRHSKTRHKGDFALDDGNRMFNSLHERLRLMRRIEHIERH
jgi:hypothetical protein